VTISLRRILLIRHGQYDENETGKLTPLGRKQAAITARAFEGLRVDAMVSSTLTRAKETAKIIHEGMPHVKLTHSALLCECVPTPLPHSLRVKLDPAQVEEDRVRADKAFAKFFRPTKTPRVELVVCHGNIIRYFACLALGVQPRAWVKMQSLHCGITEVSVLPNGETRLASYNDTGHLPRNLRTMSNAATKRD
jgi:serine/threonine-protein phosphatase PGAM5